MALSASVRSPAFKQGRILPQIRQAMNTDARRCSERVDRPVGQDRASKTPVALRAFIHAPADILTPTGGKIDIRHRTLNAETSRIARQASQADALRAV